MKRCVGVYVCVCVYIYLHLIIIVFSVSYTPYMYEHNLTVFASQFALLFST